MWPSLLEGISIIERGKGIQMLRMKTRKGIMHVAIAHVDKQTQEYCQYFLPVILPTVKKTMLSDNGEKLLMACQKSQADIDLIICDTKGINTIQQVRNIEKYKKTPVVVFCEKFNDPTKLMAVKLLFEKDDNIYFVKKYDDWNDLVLVLQKIMDASKGGDNE